MRETDGDREKRQTSILTDNLFLSALTYPQGLISSLLTRCTEQVLARWGRLAPWGHGCLSAVSTDRYNPTLTQTWDSETLTLTVSHVGICIYHFITPTLFQTTTWLLPLTLTSAFCSENLWLTARSWVNRQQNYSRWMIDQANIVDEVKSLIPSQL